MPPEGLVATVVGNVVTLRWTIPSAGPAPTGFVLEGGLSPGETLASIPTGSPSPIFTVAAPAGSFYLRLHALNDTARSAASNEILVHVNVPVAPSAPANLLALEHDPTLTLAWRNTFTGGAPTNVTLVVSGDLNGSASLGLTDTFTFAGVPPGTYTLSVVATNASGASAPSNSVTVIFPNPCTGVPQPPTNFVAYSEGRTLFVRWDVPAFGVAPTGYVLNATGTYVASVPTPLRALSGPVPPGTYILSVVAANPCGQSPAPRRRRSSCRRRAFASLETHAPAGAPDDDRASSSSLSTRAVPGVAALVATLEGGDRSGSNHPLFPRV